MPKRIDQFRQREPVAPFAPTLPEPEPVDRSRFYANRDALLAEFAASGGDVADRHDPIPALLSDDYIRRYRDLLTAVNGRLAAEGGEGLTPMDFRLRVGPVTRYSVGSYEELLIWADDLGIDLTRF